MKNITCFKAYDIRGQLGTELNVDIAYRIGRAFGKFINPKSIVVGSDIRLTSEELKNALSEGLLDAGVDVIDIGMTGSEEIYFATKYLGLDGGVEVTASHNPIDFNGMKLVREEARPISADTGLLDIKRIVEENNFPEVRKRGILSQKSTLNTYVDHLMTYVDLASFKPLKLVINSGNGAAGHVIDAIEERLKKSAVPVEIIKIYNEPDGTFPNGIPNPMLPENRQDTIDAVLKNNADMGIAFDGDFDRCFLFDEKGRFIEGYYIVGLLSDAFLQKNHGSKIIYDPRLTWNTLDLVKKAGGRAIMSKSGHSFIKERMRAEDAIYGGEMSAHHYFRDFSYCDSGMIPWLLVAELLCKKSTSLSKIVEERIAKYPSPGEINSKLEKPVEAIERVLNAYQEDALVLDKTDGISLEFEKWRFNLRSSNTEPVVRLNLETKGDIALMKEKTAEILELLRK
ncbi:MAG: phosphomannomutase CpsG [Kordiimonadaceae bacterium]|jgi:phosphomannomutase|nr:phosphomannomutase CpsG [Kordiimonadaceae bacterium]MBT7605666.1 phosphomannomutase CpsG [Kordiimonadaceae bacterium]